MEKMTKIIKGMPLKELPVPGETIPEIFLKQKNRYGANRVAIRSKIDDFWKEYSWDDYYDNVEKVAAGFLNLGVKPLDRVCLVSSNCPEWLFISLALQSIGAYLVPIYPNSTPDQVKYVVENSEANLLVVQNHEQLAKVGKWYDKIDNPPEMILMSGEPVTGIISYDQFINKGSDWKANNSSDFLEDYIGKLTPQSPVGIIYTSGTTGPPKGTIALQKNYIFEAQSLSSLYDHIFEEETISFLPLSHIAEQIQTISCAIALAFTVSFARSIETVKDDLPQIRPTLFFSVPRLYEKVYSAISESISSSSFIKRSLFNWALKVGEKIRLYRNNNLKIPFIEQNQWALANKLVFSKVKKKMGLDRTHFYLSGAAFLPVDVARFFGSMGMDINEVYGQTECTGISNATNPGRVVPGAIGPPMPGCEVGILGDGEIVIKGDNNFMGYWKDQEKTDKVLIDGWLHTGDIGYFHDDGYLEITDRKKDIIVTSGGKNIAPQNIEGMIKGYPCISQVVVIGDKRKYLTCLIALDEDNLPTYCDRIGVDRLEPTEAVKHETIIENIQKYINNINDGLARFETIKYFKILPVNFSIETGELTPTMKVKRQVVNEKYKQIIDSMY
ncbi:MAG: long-chain fatty acid--CoA ligase [Desulfobacteraceae bacterium]|nr:long-chain fatty acid--CoA ligase [Desulfobacteraceae bacterium]